MRIMKRARNRKSLSYGSLAEIRRKIESLARQHDCSMSFVQNTLLARQLGVDIGEAYDDSGTTRKTRT